MRDRDCEIAPLQEGDEGSTWCRVSKPLDDGGERVPAEGRPDRTTSGRDDAGMVGPRRYRRRWRGDALPQRRTQRRLPGTGRFPRSGRKTQCSLTELVCREELSRHQRTKLTELVRQEGYGYWEGCVMCMVSILAKNRLAGGLHLTG